jgi:cytochrome b
MSAHPSIIDAATGAASAAPVARVRILLWDLPLRLFHWSLVAAVTTAIITGQLGGNWMSLHGQAGLAIIGLVTFRLVWGVVGSRHARFASFVPTPRTLLAYVRGQWRGVGHNPLGALSVFALLGVVAVQAILGLFTNDEIAFSGPLSACISESLSIRLTGWHHLIADGLLILLGLHVAAIVFHVLAKKDNLVRPMVTGHKEVPAELAPSATPGRQERRGSIVFVVVALLAAAAAVVVASGEWLPDPPVVATAPTSAPATTW